MLTRSLTRIAIALGVVIGAGLASETNAQGVTTGAISGFVTDSEGNGLVGAQLEITNRETGITVRTTSREGGRYSAQGLAIGRGYTVTARRIGFQAASREGLTVELGEATKQDIVLAQQTAVLDAVQVTGTTDAIISPSRTGTGSTISDSALRRMPLLNRDFSEIVRTVPQVSTTTGFLSGGGVNLRQNLIQIDGAVASDPFGLGTTGQPGGQANAKSIPVDAVKEY
ncbi:MAG TPA: carboxypeptidase regulatory-like domain-containing protein, partial [Gemmatimonadaceae bacterium]